MGRFLLTVAYDGSDYFGWQRQLSKNQPTVQQKLEEALKRLLNAEITVLGASRTDRGVHALGQRVCFDFNTSIPPKRLPMALNSLLPEDIVVTAAQAVEDSFHPQHNAKRKTYEYKIENARFKNPTCRKYCEFVRGELDIIKMQNASRIFLGTHDFKAFCAAGGSAKTSIRTIYDINVIKEGGFILIRVCGNGFLYNMVRIIAGTLIYVGLGKISCEDLPEIIASRDRTCAGKTAGAGGLTLINIEY